MKRTTFPLLFGFSMVLLGGCGGGTSAPAPATTQQPQTVTGIDTPKSVSVVTAT